ncbi:host attachment protein [Jannaschia seohaensis]|uniref:Protein required for attachment to host cells n=1 Tax=Jannaschia seohaensis TaxID=475081 RepID=A0A2Y9C781_9RHOB|nr:host attachment protein [Jannaschia seohaensis]PWJ20577.1 protein required for attachment to host cells [Jannaschia seohaensis]SSA44673.1 Protein required for attachment to host cells [Jannaschia seohaensis]
MAQHKTWALVTNGVHARLLSGLDGGEIADRMELFTKGESPHLRDILSDRPGRSFSSDASGRRSAMEPGSDPILSDMEEFAQETLDTLEAELRAGHLTRLAIFAAPKMLGVLRKKMPASLSDVLVLERDLNLINLPEAELRDAVIGALQEEREA